MGKNVVLIGFMGVGKGQTARAVAQATPLFAVDCDDLIESAMNMKVRKIFARYGEQEFRRMERKTAEWLEKSVKNTVISTGGGFVNVPNLRRIGTVVHLHADFDAIMNKITSHPNAEKKIKKRPLLQDLSSARKLYEQRLPLYKDLADVSIDIENLKMVEIVNAIITRCALEKEVAE